ncbi:TPA: transposase [Streptococcus pyogenes]|nr:transposase [Streptococcus pyogenes]
MTVLNYVNAGDAKSIPNHLFHYTRQVRRHVKVITIGILSAHYYEITMLFLQAKIILDCFHIPQRLRQAITRFRIRIINTSAIKPIAYRILKLY